MVRTFRTDAEGKIICPNCGKHYTPDLPIPPASDNRRIQEIYPHTQPYQREQLLTGICSDKCWDEFLGETLGW